MRTATTDPHLWLDDRRDALVEELARCCAFPSISASADPSREALAGWIAELLGPLMDEVELFRAPGCAPIVVAHAAGTGPGRLLLYSHYDVQPPDPLELWTSDPFEPVVRGDSLYARGVCDDKADVMARLQVLRAWRECRGELPFGIAWVCEGDEEIGSPGMGPLVADRGDALRADGCLWESYLRRPDGQPELGYGCRGLLHVELTLRTLASDQHSAFAAVYRSAAGELVDALASLRGPDGRVAIAGFHDAVPAPDEAALTALAALPPIDGGGLGDGDETPFTVPDDRERVRRLVYEPTANVTGLEAGRASGPTQTIVTATARARIDFRLVPDQEPQAVVELLRAHLDAHGWPGIELTVLTALPPAAGPLDSALGRAATRAAEETMGQPHRYPIIPGSGPMHHIAGTLGVPTITGPGCTRPDSGMHAPDEHARLTDYADHLHFTLRTLELLADGGLR